MRGLGSKAIESQDKKEELNRREEMREESAIIIKSWMTSIHLRIATAQHSMEQNSAQYSIVQYVTEHYNRTRQDTGLTSPPILVHVPTAPSRPILSTRTSLGHSPDFSYTILLVLHFSSTPNPIDLFILWYALGRTHTYSLVTLARPSPCCLGVIE